MPNLKVICNVIAMGHVQDLISATTTRPVSLQLVVDINTKQGKSTVTRTNATEWLCSFTCKGGAGGITDDLLSWVLTKIILFFPCYHSNFDCCTLEMECCMRKAEVPRCFISVMKSRHVQSVGWYDLRLLKGVTTGQNPLKLILL